ncbi:MAG: LysR family transcriptional regulator [Rhodospirillaceae bacterium]
MNLKRLETFYWAATLGSFIAAAERLNSTQSTVSMRIQELERDLGVDLFNRSQRTARVTPKGRDLVKLAEQILTLSAEIRERMSAPEDIPGYVRLGVAEVISVSWLPHLIRALREKYPKIVIDMDEALTFDLYKRLQDGQLDLVLAAERLPGHDLVTRSLGRVPVAWMASPDLALPDGTLGPAELQHFPVIALSPTSIHHAKIEDWFRSGGAFCRRIFTCKSFGVAASLAAGGLGVTLLPVNQFQPEIKSGKLRIVDTEPRMPPVEFTATMSISALLPVTGLIADLARNVSTFDKS